MYYVYILISKKDRKLYVGFTNDLRRRLYEHKKGLSLALKNRRPIELIYYEAHKNRIDAINRERFLKTGWGKNYIYRILKNYLNSIR